MPLLHHGGGTVRGLEGLRSTTFRAFTSSVFGHKMASLATLPEELLLQILSNLDIQSCLNFCHTSSRFCRVLDDPYSVGVLCSASFNLTYFFTPQVRQDPLLSSQSFLRNYKKWMARDGNGTGSGSGSGNGYGNGCGNGYGTQSVA